MAATASRVREAHAQQIPLGIRLSTPPSKSVLLDSSLRNDLDTLEDIAIGGSRITDICVNQGLFEPGPGAPLMRSVGVLGVPLGVFEVRDACKKLERAHILEDEEAETAAKIEVLKTGNLVLRSAAIGASTALSVARTELPASATLGQASAGVSGAWSSFSTINAIIGMWNRGTLLWKIYKFKRDLKKAENQEDFLKDYIGASDKGREDIQADVMHRIRSKLLIYESKNDYFYKGKLKEFAEKWGKVELARKLKEAGYEPYVEGKNFKYLFCYDRGWEEAIEERLVAEEIQKRTTALQQMLGEANVKAILGIEGVVDLAKIEAALSLNPFSSIVSFESGFKFFLYVGLLFIAVMGLLTVTGAISISAPFSLVLFILGLAVSVGWTYCDGKQLFQAVKSGNTASCKWGLLFNFLYIGALLIGRVLGKVTCLDFVISAVTALVWLTINLAALARARANKPAVPELTEEQKKKAAEEMQAFVDELVAKEFIKPCALKT